MRGSMALESAWERFFFSCVFSSSIVSASGSRHDLLQPLLFGESVWAYRPRMAFSFSLLVFFFFADKSSHLSLVRNGIRQGREEQGLL